MKRKWEEPRIEVQKFEANEYVAACWVFTETSTVITTHVTGGVLTDGRTDSPTSWQGPNKGFTDDHFDFLNASDADVVPVGGGTGWYSDTMDQNIISIHPQSPGKPTEFTGGPYGNQDIHDMADPVYFWGGWPSEITTSNHTQYGVGPNAS